MTATWKHDLREAYASVEALAEAGLLKAESAARLRALGDRYQVRVTRHYAGLMTEAAGDPIRLQALPWEGEEDPVLPEWARGLSHEIYGREAPWLADAIGDLKRLAEPRLTHRYGNRALLHVSPACAVSCRFCFRKEHLNAREESLYSGPWDAAFSYLSAHPEVSELILTGGDPLSLGDDALERVLDRAAAVPSLKMVRIHSRMAVTMPSRLDEGLASVLGRARSFRVSLVSHFNHPRELTAASREGLGRLERAGVALYNQSVLLRGVNDSVEVLAELFQKLYEGGVRPFYLHHPDWTPGTFGFRVSIERGRELVRALRGRVSGPAMPEYVLDVPGGEGKVPLLDERVRLVRGWREDGLEAAVYELVTPFVREGGGGARVRYLDLSPCF